jgi:hypothetical protein
MTSPHFVRRVLFVAVSAAQLVAGAALAAVPTGYKGTPYMGTPQAIPGRVELANLDVGGEGVSYHADHRRANAKAEGYSPISGDDYRPTELDLPNICKTNAQNKDYMVGTNAPYPSTTPNKEVYYMGYAHAHDWVRMTVDVKVAGKYNVSSTWASAGGQWGLSLWFNDGTGTPATMDGVNKSGKVVMPGTSDYHKWKDYPNFTQVELSAGVQLFTFHLEQEDHLQYGFVQFDLVGGNPGAAGTGGAAGTSGAAGSNATGAAGTSGAAGAGGDPSGAAGTGDPTGTAGTGIGPTGAAGTTPIDNIQGAAGTGAPPTGAAGNTNTTGAAGGGATSGAAGQGPTRNSGGSGGCAVAAREGSASAGAAALLLACSLIARRRARKNPS